jgi:8-oxo-dGTP diphosphatase
MSAGPAPDARHSVSVAAAVVDESGRVLVIRRADNGLLEPPGGVLELDESVEDGLRREVREETGLRVEPDALSGVYKNLSRGIVALVFRCRAVGGQLRTSDESDEYLWLTADEIRAGLREAYAVRLLDALESGPPKVRSHDGTTVISP